jgi:hypothetical protein
MAGIVKARIRGSKAKKSLMSARPERKKVEKKNHPVMTRKIVIMI